jgi:hypothetical protein
MTDYSSIPQINQLYQQRENVTNSIDALDNGGYLSSIAITPAPPEAGMMAPTTMVSPISLQPPTSPETIAAIRAELVNIQADIDSQLAELGVTDAPPAARNRN